MFRCPYCKSNLYKRKSLGNFLSWKAVQGHTRKCKNNNGEYYIDKVHGPIHYMEIQGLSTKQIKVKLVNINSASDIITCFKRRNIDIKTPKTWESTCYANSDIEKELKEFILEQLKNLTIEEKLIIDSLCQFKIPSYKYLDLDVRHFSKKCKRIFNHIKDKPLNVSWNIYWLNRLGYKKCYKCNIILSLNNFYKSSLHWDGASSICSSCRCKHYSSNKDLYLSYSAKRRVTKLQATPFWLTNKHIEEIQNIYKNAIELTRCTGVKYHVDHIVPLQGDNVCGLHVPWNLQIITAKENLIKGSSFE